MTVGFTQLFDRIPENGALLSECGKYRYRLTRVLTDKRELTSQDLVSWILLNPSMADASLNDPTIRKIMGFSRRWGYHIVDVYNLFAFRETDPRKLFASMAEEDYDPVGPENDLCLRTMTVNSPVVAAWGDAWGLARTVQAGELLAERIKEAKLVLNARLALCLGRTKNGSPRHPVRLPYAARLESYQ